MKIVSKAFVWRHCGPDVELQDIAVASYEKVCGLSSLVAVDVAGHSGKLFFGI